MQVVVDLRLNAVGTQYAIRYSNKGDGADLPAPTVANKGAGSVVVREVDGSTGAGPINLIDVRLRPMELQILAA